MLVDSSFNRSFPIMSSCNHLIEFIEKNGYEHFRVIHAFFVNCTNKIKRHIKPRKSCCSCTSCAIYACLSCPYFACGDTTHIEKHVEELQHCLAVSLTSGNINCYTCKSEVSDVKFRKISKEHEIQPFHFTDEHVKDSEKRKAPDRSYLGLRGIVNLGNTCFMSAILQVFAHTPPLKKIFTTEHSCENLLQGDKSVISEMSSLFFEFESGVTTPYVPNALLYKLWKIQRNLAGYQPQDSHEFLITMLNILHMQFKASCITTDKDESCKCQIHNIFQGLLQSQLLCRNCQNISSTAEPFMVLSLDVGFPHQYSDMENYNLLSSTSYSLLNCLNRFTEWEKIEERVCQKCCSKDSSKQLVLQKLPPILSFHFKRLLDSGKKSNFIDFPDSLDMGSFDISSDFLNRKENKFDLFAVVRHIGTVSGGHYISYVKHQNRWYKCDDHIVSKVSTKEVLNTEAYMLFYQRNENI